MTLAGIDVSASGQGDTFNWQAWRGKVQFAFVKLSQDTTYADPCAQRNIAGARSIGAAVIGYHFLLNGVNGQGGAPQAEWMLRCAKLAGIKAGDGLAFDTEDGGLGDVDRSSAVDVEQALIHFDLVTAGANNELKKHWPAFNALAYTEVSIAPHLIHCGDMPLWLANPSGAVIKSIGPWTAGPSFEQTGQRQVDTDVFYGDLAALKKLAIPA